MLIQAMRDIGCKTVMDVAREAARRGLTPATFLDSIENQQCQTVSED